MDGLLEGSNFGPVRSMISFCRSGEVDWTGMDRLDTWFPYRWETGDIFYLAEGRKTPFRKRDRTGDVGVGHVLPERRVLFCVKRLVTFDEVRQRMATDEAAGSSAVVVEGAAVAAENPYPDEGDDGDWNFDDAPVDSQVDLRASLRADFDSICEQCRAASLEVPANANALFRFALQNVGAVA